VPEKPIALIFPAFVTEYPEDPFSVIPGLERFCRSNLEKAANAIDPGLTDFHYISCTFLEDELRTQYLTYLLCCSYAEFLKERNFVPEICAGYSMGIYAAAHRAGSISFEDGLLLIRKAFLEISRITAANNFGMGSLLGLTREDLAHAPDNNAKGVEMVNQNSPWSFIFSGPLREIQNLLAWAVNEGALNTKLLNVTIPYHSKVLQPAEKPFSGFIETIPVKDPVIPVISMIDQSVITDATALKKEIAGNLHTPLNWYRTQLSLQESGIKSFIECGPGKSLVKNAKFVEGEARFYSVSSIFNG
jgi:[acyl-carrier-protein] S-malonyltransferase